MTFFFLGGGGLGMGAKKLVQFSDIRKQDLHIV